MYVQNNCDPNCKSNYESGGQALYGPQFMLDYDVIMVSLNYRLGPLGFLSLETDAMPSNLGFRQGLFFIAINIMYC